MRSVLFGTVGTIVIIHSRHLDTPTYQVAAATITATTLTSTSFFRQSQLFSRSPPSSHPRTGGTE